MPIPAGLPAGLIIAGERSGVGKTTVTLALLASMARRSIEIGSFKVGPDYIDPMFHQGITGRSAYNLDPVLTSPDYVLRSYATHGSGRRCVVEGVMGLFDGASGADDRASTAHVARLLQLPVVLVVDCGRMARSVAALVQGYQQFDPRVRVAGVVLNRVGSDRHLTLLKTALSGLSVPIVGVLHREANIELPSRHLGLVPAGELSDFNRVVERLADLGERCFNWPLLERLWHSPTAPMPDSIASPSRQSAVTIAIAQSPAFNFYYPDNLALLQTAGAELIAWDPLRETLPAADGLYFGGGFPEIFAAQLAENQTGRAAVAQAIESGMPTYAECGGLMYLCQSLTDFDGNTWPMVGIMPQRAQMGQRLSLGYRQVTALQATPLIQKGATLVGHEFHRSALDQPSAAPVYQSQRYTQPDGRYLEGWVGLPNVHSSYVHLHWGARPDIPRQFVESCRRYRTSAGG